MDLWTLTWGPSSLWHVTAALTLVEALLCIPTSIVSMSLVTDTTYYYRFEIACISPMNSCCRKCSCRSGRLQGMAVAVNPRRVTAASTPRRPTLPRLNLPEREARGCGAERVVRVASEARHLLTPARSCPIRLTGNSLLFPPTCHADRLSCT